MLNRNDAATLWGVERDPLSKLVGKLVCPRINVWASIGRRKLRGQLAHETPVKILKAKRSRQDGRVYYQIRGYETESEHFVKGWVPHTFIKEHTE